MKLKAMADALLQALYPPRCPFCGETLPLGETCCDACRQAVRPAPVTRWIPLQQGDALRCEALYPYQDAVRNAVLNLKFNNQPEHGAMIGCLMADHPAIRSLARAADYVTAVPVSRKRRRERGYNQSELIARELAARCGVPYLAALEKHRHNAEQSTLNRQQRLENVIGVYRAAHTAELQGKSILLVDDIVTTGATLASCAQTLYQAGIRQAAAATFAHAELL